IEEGVFSAFKINLYIGSFMLNVLSIQLCPFPVACLFTDKTLFTENPSQHKTSMGEIPEL
ncbi:hypothetical protein, partial [Paenibacillus zanthoxyli]|uniref:hypothetical protein n=1 Tax=Paenibacillus zanthoxyli TaxID=369399 RepID=UPI000470D86E